VTHIGITWVTATIGWSGAIGLLLAYLLLLGHRVAADGRVYLSLNFLGSAGLAVCTSAAHAWPSAAVNLIWLVIGAGPLVRAATRRHSRRPGIPPRARTDRPLRPGPGAYSG
jgi:peptidoglycan/LPS O-acetylase OafA/YrhL